MNYNFAKEFSKINKRTNKSILLDSISKLEETNITIIKAEIGGYMYLKNNKWEIISFEFLNSFAGLGQENISKL